MTQEIMLLIQAIQLTIKRPVENKSGQIIMSTEISVWTDDELEQLKTKLKQKLTNE